MKRSVLFGVLLFVLLIPGKYLEAYLGIIEHRSFIRILVESAFTATLAAILWHYFMAWWERRKARKIGSDN